MENLFTIGLAASTQRSYRSGQNRYLQFCRKGNIQPLPTSETTLCRFVSYLAEENLTHRTIKAYLSAIRYLHICEGCMDPFQNHMHRLQYTLSGIKRSQAETSTEKRQRLPITPPLLRKIKEVLNDEASIPDVKMLWAACCLRFFCFLRSAKLTAPSIDSYDSSVNLCLSDISVDNPASPAIMKVQIKQSKTDPFRKGIDLYVGKTNSDLCPVTAILGYLLCRGNTPGPLFTYQDGSFLTRECLTRALREALTKAGLDAFKYCSHSFLIGAASTAAAKGLEDSVIKTLGRWRRLQRKRIYHLVPKMRCTFHIWSMSNFHAINYHSILGCCLHNMMYCFP